MTQNNLLISKNEIDTFASLIETLINNSAEDQDTTFEKKSMCVDKTNTNVFEKDEVSSSEEIFDQKKLSKLTDFSKSRSRTNCVQTSLRILICQCVMIRQEALKMS